MNRKTLTIVGARPQFIKAAVVTRALLDRTHVPYVDELVHTGQHFDWEMSDVFFEQLDVPRPVVNLGVSPGSHGETTGAMLPAVEREVRRRAPDAVIVYGDTNTTLAAALATVKFHVPVVHVEAGLRSYTHSMPEEVNRVLTDHVSSLLLCPSRSSSANLEREGITAGLRVVGDTMYDAVLHYKKRAVTSGRSGPFAIATLHRAENTDNPDRLAGILKGLGACSLPVVLPLHPRTRKSLSDHSLNLPANVEGLEPVSYLDMIGLVRDAQFVLTDSGGLQKEAYFLGKACVTLRDETEWTELVELGANRLAGADPSSIERACQWAAVASVPCKPLYGDGTAGTRIVDELQTFLNAL